MSGNTNGRPPMNQAQLQAYRAQLAQQQQQAAMTLQARPSQPNTQQLQAALAQLARTDPEQHKRIIAGLQAGNKNPEQVQQLMLILQQQAARPTTQQQQQQQQTRPPPMTEAQLQATTKKQADEIAQRMKQLDAQLAAPENGGLPNGTERDQAQAQLLQEKEKHNRLSAFFKASQAQIRQYTTLNNLPPQAAQQRLQPKSVTPLPSRPTQSTSSAPGTPGAAPSPNTRNASTSATAAAAESSSASGTGTRPSPHPGGVSSPRLGPGPNVMGTPSTLVTGAGAIPATLNVPSATPEPYPNARGPRPTLNQGLGTTPLLGTPAILQRPEPGQAWESLLGVQRTEQQSSSSAAGGRAEFASTEFWDALTGRGTGAASLNGASAAGPSGALEGAGNGADRRLLTKRKVQELVGELDGTERLDGDVEDLLLEVADEFIESTTAFACRLAKHRKGDRVEVRDVQLYLERNWDLRIPFPGAAPVAPPRGRVGKTGVEKG